MITSHIFDYLCVITISENANNMRKQLIKYQKNYSCSNIIITDRIIKNTIIKKNIIEKEKKVLDFDTAKMYFKDNVESDIITIFVKIMNNINDNEHNIDLEDVAILLKTRKRKLKETLKQSYKVNVNYTVSKAKYGQHNKEQVMLDQETFKLMLMKSKSKIAEDFRYYFIMAN